MKGIVPLPLCSPPGRALAVVIVFAGRSLIGPRGQPADQFGCRPSREPGSLSLADSRRHVPSGGPSKVRDDYAISRPLRFRWSRQRSRRRISVGLRRVAHTVNFATATGDGTYTFTAANGDK